MVTAIIFLNVDRNQINDVAEKLTDMQGVSEVYSVGGRFDLIAIVRIKRNEDLADLVTNKMIKLKGIQNTETMIAFRAYSKYDLEHMFSIGLED
jgi:DNA-binding Lrp family transcriptional regulator